MRGLEHTAVRPKLRATLHAEPVEHEGVSYLSLSDHEGISTEVVNLPPAVVLIVSLFDGEHNLAEVSRIFEERTGHPLPQEALVELAEQLDGALLLDSPRFAAAEALVLEAYHSAPNRPPALINQAYPADPAICDQWLAAFAGARITSPFGYSTRPTYDILAADSPDDADVGHSDIDDVNVTDEDRNQSDDASDVVVSYPEGSGKSDDTPGADPLADLSGGLVSAGPIWSVGDTTDERLDVENDLDEVLGPIRGLISPHIDYRRGGRVYSDVWSAALRAVREAEVIVIFGTDHSGAPGQLTFTRQSYATPFGTLPTATEVVDAVAVALGTDFAFADELHHRNEHSIELAAVWLHSLLDGQSRQIVPVLCGSFADFTESDSSEGSSAEDRSADGDSAEGAAATARERGDVVLSRAEARSERLDMAVDALGVALAGRRVLVVAAGDLAHVGPAFGDPQPFDAGACAELASADARLLESACTGRADDFLATIAQDHDRFRVCGLPPIYLTLRLLGQSTGEIIAYDQCPADPMSTSWVSVAGVVLR